MTDKAMDQLNNQFQDLSMSFLTPPKDLHAQERAKYVQQKTNPTENKDIKALEAKLALTRTEKMHNAEIENPKNKLKTALAEKANERKSKHAQKKQENKAPVLPNRLITEKTKLAAYTQELEREFDEHKALEAKETEILEAYANKHFKPVTVVKGFWESEENRVIREKEKNILDRKKFIEANREKVLGAVLRKEIKHDLERTAQAHQITALQNEDKAQELLSPFYAQRIQELKHELKKLDSDRKDARYYAKAPILPKKNITNDEPKLPNAITAHYRMKLLSNELKKPIKQEIVSAEEKLKRQELIKINTQRSNEASQNNFRITEGVVQDGHAKRFKKLV